jgi:hypothetical protein
VQRRPLGAAGGAVEKQLLESQAVT